MMKRLILVFGVMLLVATMSTMGQRTVSAQTGIFSAAQAERGMAPAVDACAACHGQDLTGGDFAPGIAGAAFFGLWDGESLDTLVTKVTQTMPLDRPGALSLEEYSDIMAYLFQTSGFAAGDAEFDVGAAGNADVTITAP
jgi:mono/diheme cytochrome c family protein